MKFHITYPTGLSEVITSECESLDALAMSVWGRISAEAVKLEHNVLIAPHIEDAPATEPEPVGEEPTAETETKVYADGTSATGVPPLPDLSPYEQDAADAQKANESAAG